MARRTILNSNGVDPIRKDMKIVNPDGTPTDAFLRNWQRQRASNGGIATNAEEAIALVNALAATNIGTTAPITGGGILGNGITPIGLADTAVTPGSYTSANITVDQKGRITAAANGSGGGGGTMWGATGNVNNIGTGANASKGSNITPFANMTVNAIWAAIDPAAVGNTYVARIYQQTGVTGTVGTLLQSTPAYVAVGTDPINVRFVLPSPQALVAGTTYLVVISITSGGGTTACRVGEATAASLGAWNINGPGINLPGFYEYNAITPALAQAPSLSFTTRVGFSFEGTF